MLKPDTIPTARKISSILMMIALAWLTACLPFVYESQQEASKAEHKTERGDFNPLSGTNEEKAGESLSSLSEYLHDQHDHHYLPIKDLNKLNSHATDIYHNFKPDLFLPPPEML